MTRNKTSIIWTMSENEIQNLLDNCSSFVEVLGLLGLSKHSGNHRTLQERIKIDNLNIEKLKAKKKEKISAISKKKKIPSIDIFVKNSNYSRSKVKQRVIQENIIDYICEKCGNDGMWNGEKLVLQLEHKNGDSKDNRLENLCFLCPNCHTQTETYSGKNNRKPKVQNFCICGKQIRPTSLSCVKCAGNKEHLQKFHVNKEDLEMMIKDMPITKIGIIFGVSDNAIRKRCKRFGIDCKKKKSG